ncbi:hypothetical protein DRN62_00070 [Nanoarchaeota archaeon]|nr:MAG: hypothetical protein DRN62_00070 [Nanoarchaeota archaeon]
MAKRRKSATLKEKHYQLIIVILSVALATSIGFILTGPITGMAVADPNYVGKKVISYINEKLVNPGTFASLVKIEDAGKYYIVTIEYMGNRMGISVSKDGNTLFFSRPVDITNYEPNASYIPGNKTKVECWVAAANSVGIDTNKVVQCVEKEGLDLMRAEAQITSQYKVFGSPTLIVNDVVYQGMRTPEAYKQAICSGFVEPPEECNQTLSGSNETDGFDAPDRDVPDVKLFVMSFCPYGNMAERAMYPVVKLLGSKANIEVHYIVSVSGDQVRALHGEKEVQENMREACIQKYMPDKFWDFLIRYLNCRSGGSATSSASGQC